MLREASRRHRLTNTQATPIDTCSTPSQSRGAMGLSLVWQLMRNAPPALKLGCWQKAAAVGRGAGGGAGG